MRIKNTVMKDGKRYVCRIYDAGDSFADRYTVAFKAYNVRGQLYWPYLASGPSPFHPGGFGQHGESAHPVTGKHLGKRVAFESLPEQTQQFILQNLGV